MGLSFKECLIILNSICFLLRFQGRPLVLRVQEGFMNPNFNIASHEVEPFG